MNRAHMGPDAASLSGLLGRRVSLRHRVIEADRRPMRSDAVGELIEVGPVTVVVRTRNGSVRVRRDDVVAVREIPPPPRKRPSWAAVSRLERICADGWPAVTQRPLGQWRLRAAGGFTGRANSALAVGDPHRSVPAALRAVVEFAEEHELAPRVQVPEGSPWHRAIAEDGWVTAEDGWATEEDGWATEETHPAGAQVEVLVADLRALAEHPALAGSSIARLTVAGRESWRAAAVEPVTTDQEHVLTAPALPHLSFVLAHVSDQLAGTSRLAVLDEHLYLTRMPVTEAHRRRGLAKAMMARASGWGLERGARWCVLQVAAHNAAALSLYRRLGFTPHHRCLYLRPPESLS